MALSACGPLGAVVASAQTATDVTISMLRDGYPAPGYGYDSSSAATTPTPNTRVDAIRGERRSGSGSRSSTSLKSPGHATKGAGEAFHYTARQAVQSIEKEGLRRGSYAARKGDLSPLQAQIDLALPPNRGLRDAVVRVDLAGLRKAGYEVPDFRQVGRKFNMPGGGQEVQFPYSVPPRFLRVMRP